MFDAVWWLAAATLLIGCTIQSAMGFGMALIAAPIIVLVRPEWVPMVLTIVAMMLSIQNAWGQRSGIQWRAMGAPMITRIPGTLLGAWALTIIPVQGLQLSVAGMVFIAIGVTLFAKPFPASTTNLSIAGFFSGISGSTTGIGGPPMALVMQHGSSHNTRANLSIYFLYSCLVSLAFYQGLGLMSQELWLAGLSFAPIAIAGYSLGRFLRPWADTRFRPLLLALCGVSAAVAMIGAVT